MKTIIVPESFGVNKDFIFFVQVEDQYKLEALLALRKSFNASILKLCIAEEKSDWVENELKEIAFRRSQTKSCGYILFTDSPDDCSHDKCLVVVYDLSVPKDAYFNDTFHVILVSPHELESLAEKQIPELNALTFVYFNGG